MSEVTVPDDEDEWEYVDEPFGGRSHLIVGVLSVALIVTIAANVYLWLSSSDLRSREDTRAAVGGAAVEFATAFLTYDYRKIDEWQEGIRRTSTANYLKNNSGDLPGQARLIKKLKVRSVAKVKELFIRDVSGNAARVVLAVDQEKRSTKRTESVTGSYIVLDLVNSAGSWKVDNKAGTSPKNPA